MAANQHGVWAARHDRKYNISAHPPHETIDTVRQRALQAAHYYHQNVAGNAAGAGGGTGQIREASPSREPRQYYGKSLTDTSVPAASNNVEKRHFNQQNVKMRQGVNRYSAEQRSSYNEKLLHRNDLDSHVRTAPSNVRPQGYGLETRASPRNTRKMGSSHSSYNMAKNSKGNPSGERLALYKSNSSLEIDHVDYIELSQIKGNQSKGSKNTGSKSSKTDTNDSFFDMLQNFQNQDLDQRAPAPPQMREVLRGKVELNASGVSGTSNELDNVPNGDTDHAHVQHTAVKFSQEQRPQSPSPKEKHKDRKARGKSITGDAAAILKKLRGTKSEALPDEHSKSSSASLDSDTLKPEEIVRQKAFVHYDCQSIGLSLSSVGVKQSSLQKRRNTTTGASAASAMSHPNTRDEIGDTSCDPSLGESDGGDGKSNSLVLSCPFFRNEIGGEEERTISLTRATAQRKVQMLLGNQSVESVDQMRKPICNGVSILDMSQGNSTHKMAPLVSHRGYILEYIDRGAMYYKTFFHGYEHQNYFGVDDQLGPLAVSIRRERADNDDQDAGVQYQYRIIVRSSELKTIRGTILEDAIPSGKLSSNRGLAHKDVLEYTLPDVPINVLKQAIPGTKTHDQLAKLDEQGLTTNYKVGVMYCRAGQSSEEAMYNNEHAGPAFEEFLQCIGQRVRLKGFDKYRAGLDNKTDSTGLHSVYTTFDSYEIMFHVSTLLPYTPNNKQQLLRKRHIGNDIVTIIFQEPGAEPFTPKTVRSHFQHVFVLVQVIDPCTDHTHYRVAVTRSKDVPPFGPPIPDGGTFRKSPEFANFLLAKVINAENAAHRSEKFVAMATRTRQEYLKDLALNSVMNTMLDSGSKLSKFALGSGRKKEKVRQKVVPDAFAKGAVIWHVQVDDFGASCSINCYLGIAMEMLVLLDDKSHDIIFAIPCKSVIGWTSQTNSLRLFYDQGECALIKSNNSDIDDIQEIVQRLSVVSQGCETMEMTLRRNGLGQLGFHVQFEGIVTDVEMYGFAWQAGLRQNSRLVEICKVATATLTHEQMIDLLRTSLTVKVVVIPPLEDGRPRRYMGEMGFALHNTSPVDIHDSAILHHREQFAGSKHWSLDEPSNKAIVHTAVNMTLSNPAKLSDTDSGIHTLQSVHNYKISPDNTLKHSPSGQSHASPSSGNRKHSPMMQHIQLGYHGYSEHSPVTANTKTVLPSSPSISSQSNLSQVSDFSSLSSNSSFTRSRPHEESRSRSREENRSRQDGLKSPESRSKEGPPPYNSKMGSPPMYKRHHHTAVGSFESNLKRITPTSSHYRSTGAINQNDTTPTKSSLRTSNDRLTRLQRTLSDESLHASRELFHPQVSQPIDLGQSFHDVIFTTAVPIQVRDVKEQSVDRLSPRAIINQTNLPSTKKLTGHHRVGDGRSLPLPDEQGLDWTNLVHTADIALKSGEGSKNSTPEHNRHERSSDYVQELEAKCLRLQQNLDKDRKEREILEHEVEQLKQDNVRLQEESQTAAAQLRKFTEWFFNTIDRQ